MQALTSLGQEISRMTIDKGLVDITSGISISSNHEGQVTVFCEFGKVDGV